MDTSVFGVDLSRRRVLESSVAVVGYDAIPISDPAIVDNSEQDWPTSLRDTRNSGFTDVSVDIQESTIGKRDVATFDAEVVTGPVLVDDTYYVCAYDTERYSIYEIDTEKSLVATSEYENDNRHPSYGNATTPTVASGVVYVTTAYGISAFDIGTGERIWFTPIAEIHSPPTVLDGRVYLAIPTHSFGGGFVSLDAENGDIEWESDTGAPSQINNDFPVAVTENTAILSDNDGNITSVTASTGEEGWNFTYEVDSDGSASPGIPTVRDDIAYCNIAGRMVALDLHSGDRRWELSYDARHSMGAPIVVDDVVLGFDEVGKVYAVSRSDGSLVWSTGALGGGPKRLLATPKTSFLHRHESITAIDIESGSELYSIESTDEYIIQSTGPITSDGITAITIQPDALALSIFGRRPAEDNSERSERESESSERGGTETESTDRTDTLRLLIALAGGVGLGALYGGYKKFGPSDDDETT
ncbi:PQQ-binding-like beta-propeller repeat protein [Natrarchaeobius oligotrophus]|uniref:Pyrrolo-quinoline quinone repeat domain-containing protein n=1 Tax=Natrarchaeobius chitinivorans TaxID=1679083 RepID=A0A3N6PGN2_NATCH|nr:PQQ-binding-like beta-propeller repeat protein [Natrarchaeobius chitinivorans]RQG99479.1 hypothetical protein EA472_14765 [Natrarchaeobius chitinivorans]